MGSRATVLQDIPGDAELGMVRVDREEWRAQSTDGSPIVAGTVVRVAEVQGTRVIVAAGDQRTLRELFNTQRDRLVELRDDGTISNDVMHRIERELDLEEERLEI